MKDELGNIVVITHFFFSFFLIKKVDTWHNHLKSFLKLGDWSNIKRTDPVIKLIEEVGQSANPSIIRIEFRPIDPVYRQTGMDQHDPVKS